MRKFVSDQPLSSHGFRRELTGGKGDVLSKRVGVRIHARRGSHRLSIGVNAHITEIMPELRLEIGALRRCQWHAAFAHKLSRFDVSLLTGTCRRGCSIPPNRPPRDHGFGIPLCLALKRVVR
jgi:hypothetical protein